jgi:hypothetical protein
MSDVLVESSSTQTDTPEATPAAQPTSFEIPQPHSEEYASWRKTGKLPEPKPEQKSKEASTPSTEKKSSEPSGSDGESVPASEAGNEKQEKKRSTAESRLNELLSDLRKAGLSPAELKTFRKAAQAEAKAETEPQATPEKTAQPEPQQPKQDAWEAQNPKPKLENYDSIESFVDAISDWKASKRDFEREQKAKAEAAQKEVNDKLAGARARYGEAADATIRDSAKAIFSDAAIPNAVKAILNDSPEMVDLLYTLGSDADGLKEFIALAKEKPGLAIRKAVLMEKLIAEELSKSSAASSSESSETPTRDENGKFVSQKEPPAKPVTKAPAPPREASGRSAAPPDAVEAAFKSNDFAAFRAAQNRRDLERLR